MTVGTVLDKIQCMDNIVQRVGQTRTEDNCFKISSTDMSYMMAIFDAYKELLCKMEVEE